jgi:UDP-glucose 4-epimerase
MKILITGGTGFSRIHLYNKYTKDRYTIFCLYNFISGNLMNVKSELNNKTASELLAN